MKGYSVNSLMDSFEWLSGYQLGFGLHHVDFQNPLRPRTPKRSAHYYYQIIMENGFPETEVEKMLYGYFQDGFAWSTATASYQVNDLPDKPVCTMIDCICSLSFKNSLYCFIHPENHT